ncbi:MAG: hypothetical protein U0X91_30850 [Spirosomataceae bacterium]
MQQSRRTNKSKLSLNCWSICILDKKSDDKKTQILCEVMIGNDGNVIESAYKINIYIAPFKDYLYVHWASNMNYQYTVMEEDRVKLSAISQAPIYPSEALCGMRFKIDVPNEKLEEALKEIKIEILLLYPNGEDRKEENLEALL